MLDRTCEWCGKAFQVLATEAKRGNGRFCTRSCSSKNHAEVRSRANVPNVNCAYCGVRFYKNATQKKRSKSGLHFCCREHKDKGQRIESGLEAIHPPHFNTGVRNYRGKALLEYGHECNRCGWSKRPEVLVVHHKDRDRENNAIENLEVLCQNCHAEDHFDACDGMYSSRKA